MCIHAANTTQLLTVKKCEGEQILYRPKKPTRPIRKEFSKSIDTLGELKELLETGDDEIEIIGIEISESEPEEDYQYRIMRYEQNLKKYEEDLLEYKKRRLEKLK